MEWLHDEISMALDGLDREHVYDLFEKAVKDYICKFPVRFFEVSADASVSATQGCLMKVRSSERRALVQQLERFEFTY